MLPIDPCCERDPAYLPSAAQETLARRCSGQGGGEGAEAKEITLRETPALREVINPSYAVVGREMSERNKWRALGDAHKKTRWVSRMENSKSPVSLSIPHLTERTIRSC